MKLSKFKMKLKKLWEDKLNTMNRVDFLESVSGIQYPEMIVHFFDHFLALKQIVEDRGYVGVLSNSENCIVFAITFSKQEDTEYALSILNNLNGTINIYGRDLSIAVEVLTDNKIKISLQ